MKITRLLLKNFNAIYTTLGMKKLSIDFTKMKHNILLFIGENGSCKTYILSNLHPFAYLGNVDVRNGLDLIIDGEDGKKEIDFVTDDGDTYNIIHHYIYQKKGRKVHSYIQKNGIELNPTGLVGTFNQMVEIEFGIDISFLRVIRLGSNVSNLVNLKSTERKEFAVKLLEEVEIYLEWYKRSVENSRNKKTSLKLVVDKMKRLNINDEIICSNEIDRLEKMLKEAVDKKEELIKRFANFQGRIEASIKGTVEDLRDELKELTVRLDKNTADYKAIEKQITACGTFIYSGKAEDYLVEITEEIAQCNIKLSSITTTIDILSKTIVDLKDEGYDLDNKIQSFQEFNDIENIEEDLNKAKIFDDSHSKYFENFKPKCTKTDLLEDIAMMQLINTLISTTREFSGKAIDMYKDLFNGKKNIRSVCMKRLIAFSSELTLADEKNIQYSMSEFDSVPQGCTMKEKCFYYKSYKRKENVRDSKSIEEDIDVVNQCIKVAENIERISIMLESRKKGLPYVVKREAVILDILNGTREFFNFAEAETMVRYLETYEEFVSNRVKIANLEKDLEYRKKQRDAVDGSIIERRKKVMIELSDREDEMKKCKKKKKHTLERLDYLNRASVSLGRVIELQNKKDVYDTENKQIETELRSLHEKKVLLDSYVDAKEKFNSQMDAYSNMITNLQNDIYNKKVSLNEYRQLLNEKETLENSFSRTELIKAAVSATKGIPLVYINMYLNGARMTANRIIKAVYGDKIQLNKFIINDKEFSIPYTKNGLVIEDVTYASQGELAVISLALSFAIMEQFTAERNNIYNILLLDEVDGTLDKESKEKFLRVLESQMERINCQQAFMITHNQLFENYPVDAYVTISKDNITDIFKNVNLVN